MKTSRWVFSTVVLLASSCGVQDTSNTQGLNLNSSPKAAAADTALNGTFPVQHHSLHLSGLIWLFYIRKKLSKKLSIT